MEAKLKIAEIYQTKEGRKPFEEWVDSLKDKQTQVIIAARIARIRAGNLGLYRAIGSGVCELKINYGPGYRVYFGQAGSVIIVLLCGGDKKSQSKDIKIARSHWNDYLIRSQKDEKKGI